MSFAISFTLLTSQSLICGRTCWRASFLNLLTWPGFWTCLQAMMIMDKLEHGLIKEPFAIMIRFWIFFYGGVYNTVQSLFPGIKCIYQKYQEFKPNAILHQLNFDHLYFIYFSSDFLIMYKLFKKYNIYCNVSFIHFQCSCILFHVCDIKGDKAI